MPNKNIDLEISVKNSLNKIKIINKRFLLFIKEDFLLKNKYKAHNLENHIDNFKEKIKINQQAENTNRFQKYEIYYTNFWINIWNEINWIRPSLIIKSNRHNWWFDIIVIPMTWLYNWDGTKKSLDLFDIIIKPDKYSRIKKDSILKVSHLKTISKKRILWKIWKIKNYEDFDETMLYDKIDNKIKQIMWIK